MLRTHDAGTLRASDIGKEVTLAGWVGHRRDHGGVAFIDLRDASGLAQVVIRDEILESSGAHDLRNEYCIRVTGVVEARPEGNANPNLPTGEIEVAITELEVLNPSAPLPFQIDEHVSVGEDARLKYRYLDLRRPHQHEALVLRSHVTHAIREVLDRHNFFYDIETPTLTRSTPEGARDFFLVPARLAPGCWYALPQSPQLFKQLLMVSGMERYYQIARCYRDEDFRADRQPEFTQLDVEMSFVDQDDVIALAEETMAACWKIIGVDMPTPLPRITWHEAMDRYGSDKPDLRFGNEITEVTDFFANTAFRVFQAPYVGAVVMPGGAPYRAVSSTPGRSGRAPAEPRVWPTSRSLARACQKVQLPKTSPRRRRLASPRRSAPNPVMPSSLLLARRPPPRSYSAPPVWKSAAVANSLIHLTGLSAGWLTRRCSSPPRKQRLPATSPLAPVPGPPSTTPSPARPPTAGYLRHRSGFSFGLRLRLRCQRQRGRRRVHPYPSP